MFGNWTFDAVLIGTFMESHDDKPTERLDFLWEAKFVKPNIEQDIGNGPEEMVAVAESLMTRRGSVAEYTKTAEPVDVPNAWEHRASSVAV